MVSATLEFQREEVLIVEDTVRHDKDRWERVPGLHISLEGDGRFLNALLSLQGAEGLAQRLGGSFQVYGRRAADGQVDAKFLSRYRETLEAAVSFLPDTGVREELERIIARAAQASSIRG